MKQEKQITIVATGDTDNFDRPLYKEQNGTRMFVDVSSDDEPVIYTRNEDGDVMTKVQNFKIDDKLQSIANDMSNSFKSSLAVHAQLRDRK